MGQESPKGYTDEQSQHHLGYKRVKQARVHSAEQRGLGVVKKAAELVRIHGCSAVVFSYTPDTDQLDLFTSCGSLDACEEMVREWFRQIREALEVQELASGRVPHSTPEQVQWARDTLPRLQEHYSVTHHDEYEQHLHDIQRSKQNPLAAATSDAALVSAPNKSKRAASLPPPNLWLPKHLLDGMRRQYGDQVQASRPGGRAARRLSKRNLEIALKLPYSRRYVRCNSNSYPVLSMRVGLHEPHEPERRSFRVPTLQDVERELSLVEKNEHQKSVKGQPGMARTVQDVVGPLPQLVLTHSYMRCKRSAVDVAQGHDVPVPVPLGAPADYDVRQAAPHYQWSAPAPLKPEEKPLKTETSAKPKKIKTEKKRRRKQEPDDDMGKPKKHKAKRTMHKKPEPEPVDLVPEALAMLDDAMLHHDPGEEPPVFSHAPEPAFSHAPEVTMKPPPEPEPEPKLTLTASSRIERVPFPAMVDRLRSLAHSNPNPNPNPISSWTLTQQHMQVMKERFAQQCLVLGITT